MTIRATCGILALTLAAGLSGCDGADEAAQEEAAEAPGMQAPAGQQPPPEAMALMVEVQQIQAELQPIAQQAMQDEELSAQLTELQNRIQAAMQESDPDAMARMEDLRARIEDAAADPVQQQALMGEAQQIQAEMQALQTQVMQEPGLQEAVEEFEEAQREAMVEIDPAADSLLTRLDSLVAELQAQAPQMPAGQTP